MSLSPVQNAASSDGHPSQGITVGYDTALDVDGDPVVLLRLDMHGLALMPRELLESLAVTPGRRDKDGDPVFFVGKDDDVFLMVDTDRYPDLKRSLRELGDEAGITVDDNLSELRALCTEAGDIGTPDMPGWVKAGHERVATAEALERLHQLRAEDGSHPARGKAIGDDDPRPD